MTSQVLNKWIVQLFGFDLLVCVAAYGLQRVNGHFIWVFIASLIILLWLAVAGVWSFIEVIVDRDGETGTEGTRRRNSVSSRIQDRLR